MREVICSGGLFLSMSSKRFLFLHRTQGKTADTWGLVGGKKEPVDDAPYNTLIREIAEELGGVPQVKKVIPLEFFSSTDQLFQYNTYILLVDQEFIPQLNKEHNGYAWCDLGVWPRPLHRGVQISLNNKIIKTKLEIILELVSNSVFS